MPTLEPPPTPPPRRRAWPAFAIVGFAAGILTVILLVRLYTWLT